MKPHITEEKQELRAFLDATRQEMLRALKPYGFTYAHARRRAPEAEVLFVNPTTAIRVLYEIGGTPWVEISRRDEEKDRTSLDLLVRLYDPKFRAFPSPITPQEVRDVLSQETQLLIQYGAPFLKGDFALLPQLATLAKKNFQEREQELFGSRV